MSSATGARHGMGQRRTTDQVGAVLPMGADQPGSRAATWLTLEPRSGNASAVSNLLRPRLLPWSNRNTINFVSGTIGYRPCRLRCSTRRALFGAADPNPAQRQAQLAALRLPCLPTSGLPEIR